MDIKKKFLTLSIKHQISIILFLIYILCLFSTLGIFSLYTEIIVGMQYRKRKEYLYQKYKDIIDSQIRFQTFLLFQYEELIKVFNSQIYYYSLSNDDLFENSLNYKNNLIKDYKETTDEDYKPDIPDYEKKYYFLDFSDDSFLASNIFYFISGTFSVIDNKFSILKNFRIPCLGKKIQIINDYLLVNLVDNYLISENRTKIKEIEEISNGNFSGYYEKLINYYVNKYKNFMNNFKKGELSFMDIFLENKFYLFQNYINETYLRENYSNYIRRYLNDISYNFHFIDYSTEKTFLTDNGNIKKVKALQQNNIIKDYINNIFFVIQDNLNLNSIPVFPENNTIMSVNLCFSFLYKQMIFLNLTSDKNLFSEEKIKEIYDKLIKGESNIGDCILDKKYNIETDTNAYKILNIKFNKFYSIKNIREFSLFKISDTIYGEDLFCVKYIFPDFGAILNFRPNFFSMEQLNLYCFKPFIEPKHYENNVRVFYANVQFFIILFLFYLWIIILFILVLRKNKLFIEIIEPINNLIKSINHLEVKKENMLKYEADDTINELFQLINNLLLGKYRKKINHDSEIGKGIDFNDNNKNFNDFSNLKINRKLIEEMMENKEEQYFQGDEIMSFRVKEPLNINNIKYKTDLRKTAIIKKHFFNSNNSSIDVINNIQRRIQKTNSIDHTINLLNKKMSFEVNLGNNFNSYSVNENEENILEFEIILNYKYLYDIIELIFNYDLKYDKKFISKKSKLLYKNNIKNYNKYHRLKSGVSEKKSLSEKKDKYSIKEYKSDSKIRIEDFDKSAIEAYQTSDLIFLWYLEAKYFKGVEFLQKNHAKDLNNLCNLNIVYDNKKQLISSEIKNKKVSIIKKVSHEINIK